MRLTKEGHRRLRMRAACQRQRGRASHPAAFRPLQGRTLRATLRIVAATDVIRTLTMSWRGDSYENLGC